MLETMATVPMRDIDPTETTEWLASMEGVLRNAGPARAKFLLDRLIDWGRREGVVLPFTANTPYVKTIPVDQAQVSRRSGHRAAFPGIPG